MRKSLAAFAIALLPSLFLEAATDSAALEKAKTTYKFIMDNKGDVVFPQGKVEIPFFDSAANKLKKLSWQFSYPKNDGSSDQFTHLAGIPALATTWNVQLADLYGHVLGKEHRAANIDALFLSFLNFSSFAQNNETIQSFGEDPALAIKLSESSIKAAQSHNIAVFAGDFNLVANGKEIDARTLHELYLPVLRSAVKTGETFGIIVSGDLFGKEKRFEKKYLIRGIIRGNWGFVGPLITEASSADDASCDDVDFVLSDREKLRFGSPASKELSALRLFYLMAQTKAFQIQDRDNGSTTNDWHSAIAQRVAEESIVLLKNSSAILPVDPRRLKNIAIIESFSGDKPKSAIRLSNGIKEFFKDDNEIAIRDFALESDQTATLVSQMNPDLVLIVLPFLKEKQEAAGEIEAIAKKLKEAKIENIVAVGSSHCGLDFALSKNLDAILHVPSPGADSPKALAKIIFGEVNPSGKLNFTWPKDESAAQKIASQKDAGRYTGYRWYDKYSVEPLFHFGHGLSYTKFEYEVDLAEVVKLPGDEGWSVTFPVKNIGNMKGKEVVQIYTSYPNSKVERYEKELKGFAKTKLLEPNESEELTIVLSPRDLAYWDVFLNRFRLDEGDYAILVGSSAGDIRGKAKISVSKDYVFED